MVVVQNKKLATVLSQQVKILMIQDLEQSYSCEGHDNSVGLMPNKKHSTGPCPYNLSIP